MALDPERTDRLQELIRRIGVLEEHDRLVLTSLITHQEKPLIDPIQIASDELLLPSLVEESLEKLQELGFICNITHDNRDIKFLNVNGIDAGQILALLERKNQ